MAKYYQVSTLQALALGFSKSVITVDELLEHGDSGTPAFDTYALKGASQDEIKSVEQGKGATK